MQKLNFWVPIRNQNGTPHPSINSLTPPPPEVEDEMRAKVNTFSKLSDISMTKAKRQKAITDYFIHNEHKL